MIFYVNGDSNCAGAELELNEKNFSQIVAENYNLKLVNQSLSGSSNEYILRTATEFISNYKPNFVLIGWTTWEREEWFHNNQYWQINSSVRFTDPVLVNQYQNWVMSTTQENMIQKGHIWHDKIFEFHKHLTALQVPHLFFHGYFDFFVQANNQYDWGTNFYSPYDAKGSFYWTLKNQGLSTTKNLHFLGDGHAAWAKILISHINKHVCLR